MPKIILVTGAAGFIVINYVRIMLSLYSDIKIISNDKLTYACSLDNLKYMNNEHN
ncbi:dTDP-glucose 4,6-dehydratase, partial [Francisella tularensis subsp. holarctica]|nr:dTDP-glucose 4,6-dehydratase [Francisella tularensis subsp. holarctica]